MLTLAAVAENPTLVAQDIRLRDGAVLHFRPLLPNDVQPLTDFLRSLSAQTRHFWASEGYDEAGAAALCDAIARYDKLRLVAVDPNQPGIHIVALMEFSFEFPASVSERFASYQVMLTEAEDCRFGPCVRDNYHRRGVASALMPTLYNIARRFGKRRIFLWGGVLAENEPAIAFYQKQGFAEVGRFTVEESLPSIDMIREL